MPSFNFESQIFIACSNGYKNAVSLELYINFSNGPYLLHRTDTHNGTFKNRHELERHYAKWNTTDTERQILCNLTYMWNLKKSNLYIQSTRSYQGLQSEGNEILVKG